MYDIEIKSLARLIFLWGMFLLCPQLSYANEAPLQEEIVDPALISISDWQTSSFKSDRDLISSEPDQWKAIEQFSKNRSTMLIGEVRLYKADFAIGWHHRTRDLAISIGPLRGADEVYINGFRVDDLGQDDLDVFYQSKSRVYRLPRNKVWFSWLNYTKKNVLTIKTSFSRGFQSVDFDSIEIGDYESLALKAQDSDSKVKTTQGAVIALLLILVLFSVFLRINQYLNRSNELFGFFVFVSAFSIASTSLFFDGSGIGGDFLVSIGSGLDYLSVVVFSRFISDRFNMLVSSYKKGVEIVGSAAVVVLLVFYFDTPMSKWIVLFVNLIMVVIILSDLLKVLKNKLLGLDSNYSIILASVIILLGAVLNCVWVGNSWPLTSYHIAAIVCAIFLLYSIAQDFKKMTLSMHRLSSRLVNIREIERARLTREIHDGVGQGLATIRLFITMNIDKFEPQLGTSLKQEVDQTSNTLKSVIRNLKPIEIDSGDPSNAIIELARHLCEIAQIQLEVVHADKANMNTESAYQLYRIGQEALNNSIKHSGCDQISIDIQQDHDVLKMSIADNGKGIARDIDDLGYGLSSMKERSLLIRGNLQITNIIDGGTQVYLEVPIND